MFTAWPIFDEKVDNPHQRLITSSLNIPRNFQAVGVGVTG